eukprot:CAMPEP_0115008380 /NCGR_PEP_ID=MMETSP0216-20121206/21883_1 /TAXON_ID=223996 /ORGANISM="Protocruzia adherens, Strain Boccale" /LENGTH=94 /DNA_ID=CAMNT_0002375787 /DNA_START=1 /DNA_END=282 /DNA_ORIENTATION=+
MDIQKKVATVRTIGNTLFRTPQFYYKPMIRFLGKRSLIKAAAPQTSQTVQVPVASGPRLVGSDDCSFESLDRRSAWTEEECDIVNNGGNEVEDW